MQEPEQGEQPQTNGTIATAHRAAVRAGSVVGVTPTTGSLARIDRVSQYVAIMPNPPRKIAGYGFTVSISVTAAPAAHVVHAVITTANRKTGLRTNRRSLPGGERDERGPAGGGFGPGGRERRGHDATSSAGS